MNVADARWVLFTSAALVVLAPSPQANGDPSTSATPGASGQRGPPALLQLNSPLPERAYYAPSSFDMGSTTKDLTYAIQACQVETYGHTCTTVSYRDEAPKRRIELSRFWLDRYEVTVEKYARCVQARRCAPIPFYQGAARFNRPGLPATMVTWQDARDYCTFVGARLPTEAEWERAAAGLTRRRYPWGQLYNDKLSNHGKLAWDPTDDSDGFAELAPVGSFTVGATIEHVFDLAGNAEEWVHDRYGERYDPRDLHDPQGPALDSGDVHRVLRGGSFASPRVDLRTAARSFDLPNRRKASRGFRCAVGEASKLSGAPSTHAPAGPALPKGTSKNSRIGATALE
jgi:formylglycine-generating enzyme required for sulfatase activity